MECDSPHQAAGLYPYLHSLLPAASGVLAEMEEYGRRRRFPFVGSLVGRFLQQMVMLTGAKNVLELGSGFGYSASWFLSATPEVRVTCTDTSPFNGHALCDFLGRLGFAGRIDFQLGDSVDLAREMDGPFDIVYCDLEKSAYLDAWQTTSGKIRGGGAFIADNALWRGYAWDEPTESTPEFRRRGIQGVRELNRVANADTRFVTSILPIRDGLLVAVRRSEQ